MIFIVTLSSPLNAGLEDEMGMVTILDSDQPVIIGGCDDITITVDNGTITTSGYSDPIVFVKVYSENWASVLFDSGMLVNNETQTIMPVYQLRQEHLVMMEMQRQSMMLS